MNDTTDTVLDAIDTAVLDATVERCASCGRRLPTGQFGRSLYFCGEDCQAQWHSDRVVLGRTPDQPAWDAAAERAAHVARSATHWQVPPLSVLPAVNHNALVVREPDEDHETMQVDEELLADWRQRIATSLDIPLALLNGRRPFAESVRHVFGVAVPPLRELGRQLHQAGAAANALVRSCPEAFAVDPAQLDVQQEGAGDSPMQQAIRAKRHRPAGPQARRGGPPRTVTPRGAWIRNAR